MKKGIVIFLAVVLIPIIASGFGSSETSKELLIGTWIIEAAVPHVSPHHGFVFFENDTFEIYDENGITIEKNRMTEITNSSFVGNIIYVSQHHPLPEIEGTSTYALYEIVNEDRLKLRFYDNDTLITSYVIFYLDRAQYRTSPDSGQAEAQKVAPPDAGVFTSYRLCFPVILDGQITSSEEWADTVAYSIPLDKVWGWPHRQVNHSAKVLTARFKNDAIWLYMLYEIPWDAMDVDNDDGGFIELFSGYCCPWQESDFSGISYGGSTSDLYGWDDSRWYKDTDQPDGRNDVEGDSSHDGTSYWFEFRKRLTSGDGYDWDIDPPQIVSNPNDPAETRHLLVGIWDESDRATYEQNVSLHLSWKFFSDMND